MHNICPQNIFNALIVPIVSFIEIYVVEFQKCGLPHAHILLTVATKDKPAYLEDVDRLISVKIHDQIMDPLAYDTSQV